MTALVRIVCAATILLTGAAWAAAQQDGVKLQYKFKKGEKLTYQKQSVLKIVETAKDVKVETEMTTKSRDVVSLQEVGAKGNIHLQTQNQELAVNMNLDIKGKEYGKVIFDSKAKDKNKSTWPATEGDPLKLFERVAGAKLTIVLTPQGKITELQGFKDLLADLDTETLAKYGASEEAARINAAEFFPSFPDKAVSPGDKWEMPYEIDLPKIGKVKGQRNYWYQGESKVGGRKTAKISVASELSIDLKLDKGGAKITGTLSISSSKGTIEFDPQAGYVVSLENELTMSGKLNVAINGMDIPVPHERTQQYSMKLVEGK